MLYAAVLGKIVLKKPKLLRLLFQLFVKMSQQNKWMKYEQNFKKYMQQEEPDIK